jgi:hypothetical protein
MHARTTMQMRVTAAPSASPPPCGEGMGVGVPKLSAAGGTTLPLTPPRQGEGNTLRLGAP